MLIPPPVVVDADVLIRNVDYAVRRGYVGALTRYASAPYSMISGVVLFASAEAGSEVLRHLDDIADRRRVDIGVVHQVWNERFVPAIRFVDVSDGLVDDPRIPDTHPKDRHTARLACLLAPAVLATDNRKHFEPFCLAETKTDAVAVDLATVGEFVSGAKGVAIIPTAAGALTIDGAKKVIEKLGRGDAMLLAIVLLGGLVLLLTSERGRRMRDKLGEIAAEAAPMLAELSEDAYAAGDRVHAFAIDQVVDPDAVGLVARCLATEKAIMTTVEVADWLTRRTLRFEGGRAHRTETRAWLVRTTCFEEVARGHWALGYHAGTLSAAS